MPPCDGVEMIPYRFGFLLLMFLHVIPAARVPYCSIHAYNKLFALLMERGMQVRKKNAYKCVTRAHACVRKCETMGENVRLLLKLERNLNKHLIFLYTPFFLHISIHLPFADKSPIDAFIKRRSIVQHTPMA